MSSSPRFQSRSVVTWHVAAERLGVKQYPAPDGVSTARHLPYFPTGPSSLHYSIKEKAQGPATAQRDALTSLLDLRARLFLGDWGRFPGENRHGGSIEKNRHSESDPLLDKFRGPPPPPRSPTPTKTLLAAQPSSARMTRGSWPPSVGRVPLRRPRGFGMPHAHSG